MKVPLLAGIASGLILVSGTTSAWGDCRQVRVDGVSHQVCDNSPTVVYPQTYGQGGYGGGAFQQGAAEGAADLLRLQMLLNALPPSPPPALPPGGADVQVVKSKTPGTVRMVNTPADVEGCVLLSAVKDDEWVDLAEKVLHKGGTHALLTGTKGKYIFGHAYRCEKPGYANPSPTQDMLDRLRKAQEEAERYRLEQDEAARRR